MVPKFRAWDKAEKRMYLVASIDFVLEKVELWKGTIRRKYGIASSIQDSTDVELMQSTGLKDKNGVEIFEGFAVYHEEGEFSYKGIVRKDKYYFYIEGIGINDSFSFDDVSDTRTGEADLVVIGNIYENPELLEKTNES